MTSIGDRFIEASRAPKIGLEDRYSGVLLKGTVNYVGPKGDVHTTLSDGSGMVYATPSIFEKYTRAV